MLLTEAEARTRWCPHALAGSPIFNRRADGEPTPLCRCIASSCMAWRWHSEGLDENYGPKEPTRGYCGLAGTP